jgi:hypothetical protein
MVIPFNRFGDICLYLLRARLNREGNDVNLEIFTLKIRNVFIERIVDIEIQNFEYFGDFFHERFSISKFGLRFAGGLERKKTQKEGVKNRLKKELHSVPKLSWL